LLCQQKDVIAVNIFYSAQKSESYRLYNINTIISVTMEFQNNFIENSCLILVCTDYKKTSSFDTYDM